MTPSRHANFWADGGGRSLVWQHFLSVIGYAQRPNASSGILNDILLKTLCIDFPL